ncbi:carbohydrate kinase family protein [Streptomyces silvisoli]|uniref:Carbohydrate kinase n=1 Tax=Streptomyces silvisoli TaxID=3034235 RepID=A0ABT5ZVM4_9ACTN|nr:carbohydrate kinase [Streptomyces silvisoli]MDF3293879.1 carbohydrate kinase [Streptomyces silvisoli]
MTPSQPPVLVIGEALTDVLCGPDGSRSARPGGSPANVALGLARLGHPVRLATSIGQDPNGQELLRHLLGSGVELTDGSVVPGPSPTATAVLDKHGSATYTFDLHWEMPPSTLGLVREGAVGHLHTGSIATALAPGAPHVEAAVRAARAVSTVSYDPNLRPSLLGGAEAERPRVEAFVAASDVVKASQEDLAWLYPERRPEEVAAGWTASGPSLVVLTRGPDSTGVFWRAGGCEVPVPAVRVVDTVGAGDAFMAGLLSGLLGAGLLGDVPAGADSTPRTRLRAATAAPELDAAVTAALARANLVAALTCGRPGADPPTLADLAAHRSAALP